MIIIVIIIIIIIVVVVVVVVVVFVVVVVDTLPVSEKDLPTAAKPANGEMLEHSGLLSATLKALIVFRTNLGFVTVHRGSMINTADPYSGSPGL